MNATVRAIVEGETKFSKNLDRLDRLESKPGIGDAKNLDLKQLFLAMTEEVRVLAGAAMTCAQHDIPGVGQ